ncbi:hypothetical protein FLGE108171_09315 [Flavobacterium gelidilacus]|uniref:hypothetical protein n=1 Tax=Flavobacterium gelidilacus TaxID=206041 RepID=UPI0004286234|nr:hypothetical protein [Flavobacterium gelidilacus]
MKKIILIAVSFIVFLSCSNLKTVNENNDEVGVKQKTANPNIPYIYKNGFKNFEIIKVLSVNNNDSIYLNELRFNAVYSAMYSQKLMYDKYGKWDNEVWVDNDTDLLLIWHNIKLLDSNDELFSVVTGGVESREEIFATVIVFDSDNQDCLTDTSEYKKILMDFFSTEIKNLSSKKDFYDQYFKTAKKYFQNK